MDKIAKKLSGIKWLYADKDAAALAALETRIADTGSQLGLITYSKLVSGVIFRLPNFQQGCPYEIHVHDWSGFDRMLIGDFLGFISTRSYLRAGFMASALVVNRVEFKPSEQFFQWMEDLGVLSDLTEATVLAFWADQVNKAHKWYQSHR